LCSVEVAVLARLLVLEVWVGLDVQVDEDVEDVEDVAVVEVVSLRERIWRGKDCEGFSFWPILVLFCSDFFFGDFVACLLENCELSLKVAEGRKQILVPSPRDKQMIK
jgi:hypothetical protein